MISPDETDTDAIETGDWVDELLEEHRRRWQAGERIAAAEFLRAHPSLAADELGAASVVFQEYRLRVELGESADYEIYLEQFPQYVEALRQLHEADQLVDDLESRAIQSHERIGDYELLQEIGRGGMGVVYKARQVSLKRTVAVKMLLAGALASDEELARFRTEAETVAKLRHPNLVAVHEVGEQDGRYFFAMDYVAGTSLSDLIRKNPLPPVRAAHIVQQLACAIEYAHRQGVVHRDLKPANVLIDADDQPRITDFGLARQMEGDARLTATGHVLGTPGYMSPEQAAGARASVGPASDVYALGAILYELVTGRPPFRADTALATLQQVLNEEPAAPRLLNRQVPRDLQTICLKCLRKVQHCRYGSAALLADDLQRFIAGDPIRARPTTSMEHLKRWARTRPARATLLAALVVAVPVLLVGFFLWQAARNDAELHAARRGAAEDLALANEYQGLVNAVGEQVANKEAGWTWKGLEQLKKAGELRTPARDVLRLRRLAAECLAGVDFRHVVTMAEGIGAFCLALSPDGKRLAIGENWSDTEAVTLIYSVPEGNLLRRIPFRSKIKPNEAGVRSLAFSPDGRRLAIGTRAYEIHLLDTRANENELISWTSPHARVWSLAFDPEGRFLAACGDTQEVTLWDPASGKLIATVGHGASAGAIAFFSGRRQLACISNLSLTFHDLSPTGASRMASELGVHGGRRLSVSADGAHLVYTYDQHFRRVSALGLSKNLDSVRLQSDTEGNRGSVRSLSLTSDGSLLLCGADDGSVCLWEVPNGRVLFRHKTAGTGNVYPVLTPDGRYFATTESDRTCLYEINGSATQSYVALNYMSVRAFQLSRDGEMLATVAQPHDPFGDWRDVHFLTWDLPSGKLAGQAQLRHDNQEGNTRGTFWGEPSIGLHPVQPTAAFTYGWGKGIHVWNATSRQSKSRDSLPLDQSLCFSGDGRTLWGLRDYRHEYSKGGSSARAQIVAISWPECKVISRLPVPRSPKCLVAGQEWILIGGRDGFTKLLQASDGSKLFKEWESPGKLPVHGVALSPDETLAASGSQDGHLQIVRIPSGDTMTQVKAHRDSIESVAFSSDARMLATGSKDKIVRLWGQEGDSFRELIALPFPGSVVQVAFTPDTKNLAVLVQDEYAVRLWHLDRLEQQLTELGLGW